MERDEQDGRSPMSDDLRIPCAQGWSLTGVGRGRHSNRVCPVPSREGGGLTHAARGTNQKGGCYGQSPVTALLRDVVAMATGGNDWHRSPLVVPLAARTSTPGGKPHASPASSALP